MMIPCPFSRLQTISYSQHTSTCCLGVMCDEGGAISEFVCLVKPIFLWREARWRHTKIIDVLFQFTSSRTFRRTLLLTATLLVVVSPLSSTMVSVSAHSPQTYHFVPASSGSNFYYVGAEASGSDALPNSGVQATIQVVSQPVSDCLSYWVSDDLSNNMWGQVGYSICGGSTPWAFWEVWNLNTTSFVNQSFAPVTTGYHKFSMYLQSGTIWAYALDGQVFGTYDMGARVSSSSYPVYALSEEGYVSAPWNPVQVTFSVAIQVMQSGTWQYVQTASSFGNSWGLQGNLQDSSLADDEM